MKRQYVLDGREVKVLSENPLVVQEIVEATYGDEVYEGYGQIFTTDRVFDNPPTTRLNAEVARLNKEIAVLTQQVYEERSALLHAQHERQDEIKRLAGQDDALFNLSEIFNGGITHFVEWRYGRGDICDIAELATQMQDSYRSDRHYIMTADLIRCRDGELTWRVFGSMKKYGAYLDEEGVTLCSSYEQALAVMADKLRQAASEGAKVGVLEIARKYNLESALPDGYEEAIHESARAEKRKEIERVRAKLDELYAELGVMQASFCKS